MYIRNCCESASEGEMCCWGIYCVSVGYHLKTVICNELCSDVTSWLLQVLTVSLVGLAEFQCA